MSTTKPEWDVSTPGRHPALANLTVTDDELEMVRANNERLQAELAELRQGVGGGLSDDNKWITYQESLVRSYAAQLAHWQNKSLRVGEKKFVCKNGHAGSEWDAIQGFTVETPEGRIESRHGDLGCPQCGSVELEWTEPSPRIRSDLISGSRLGLITALYRLGRFDEAASAATGDGSRALPGFGTVLARVKQIAEAVYKPDGRCKDQSDYQEWDKIYSAFHGRVLPVLRCPVCGDLQVMLDLDVLQPEQAKLRVG